MYKKVNPTFPPTTTTYTTTASIMYVPSVPYTSGQLPYSYYYTFNYNDFIRMINTCLGELMRSGSIGQSFEGVYDYFPPFMEMDPATFRCSLTVDKHFLLICMKVTPIQLRTRLSQYTLTQRFTLSFRRYPIILTLRQEN